MAAASVLLVVLSLGAMLMLARALHGRGTIRIAGWAEPAGRAHPLGIHAHPASGLVTKAPLWRHLRLEGAEVPPL